MRIYIPPRGRDFFAARQEGRNGAPVTVTAAATLLTEFDVLNVTTGDLLFCNGYVEMVKGATAGPSILEINLAGGTTGAEFFSGVNVIAVRRSYHQNVLTERLHVSGIATALGNGSVNANLFAYSLGSNGSVAALLGALSVARLKW